MNTTIYLTIVLIMLVMLFTDALRFRFRQRELQKHDRVLFPFCQLRRDVIRFLYINVMESDNSLSQEEYKFIRQLLHALDLTIHNYNHFKTSMFNVRKIAKHLKMYRKMSKTALGVPDHPEIRDFDERIHRSLVAAFFYYTPLIRWELALRLMVFAYRMAKHDAARRREAEYVVKSAEKVRSDAQHYNADLRYA
ncbi:MAG: hypothetical protein OXC08_12625 [Thiotrichales bacterium]|nr:hypothetical protein [Thiotrichales bacterium]